MLYQIIQFSVKNKLLIFILVATIIGTGIYSLMNIPIGAVPDVTNNQVQVITTTRDLAAEDVEKFITYPIELEMANLPGVEEIRSISKFGLSVVTIVFEDRMGTYLPRQLISEKISAAQERIPEGFGKPFMGPISTGLGEIYQYTLDLKPGYENRYTVTELRTIQDWIVKRQLSGIPGVVEVNTWGGFLKTYEVAVDPQKIKSLDINLTDVYQALSENNSITGGGYIEKNNEAYFIRSEGLVKSLEDIRNIVVVTREGLPIFIRDIAEAGFGAATRFGAISGNGEGEKVLGQVMMLKGANSKFVIDRVKERVNEVQSTLPEGVYINPIVERSELISRTTNTIAENLIFGFLIVLLVVVFLLGDIRSGLVVASIIPLTLLFALSLMYLFGVDANLMSLGAIDFGIIIDGAVIIVEYIAFSIARKSSAFDSLDKRQRALKMDKLSIMGANEMMHSAIFGQLIIIIVFIPILSLSGVEGKMFRPMALTFVFALIGAMILCFTYVPVMASLFLKPFKTSKRNLSFQFVGFLQKIYARFLRFALKIKWYMLGGAVALIILAITIFNRLGAEFIPTLDEGDFVIQPVLKTGMSLQATVEMTTRMEKILKRFPEVNQTATRIGAAEVPTDPMSMEESDLIITLHEKSSWTSAKSKDELADVFKEALLKEIPGIEIEFTQPIEMRFNELITGVRADLAIKVFGEDLDQLFLIARNIEDKIAGVEGASDISVEKIDGLPQMKVSYDRGKMAKYGVNISDLNDIIAMGFAGKSAGSFLEGERMFDLVLRYQSENRNSIEDLKNSMVKINYNTQLPLSEFADISMTYGPAKISRDDTKRRVVVGINVRGRDLQSVVDEVQEIINSEVDLPAGYSVEYGGQFENLQDASKRLMLAVPIALLLIFILLYFAFRSFKEAVMIFTAIPLAAVGGVIALYVRDMPFSISAGVGFIALFGIAVLNGIVMIEHIKDLKKRNPDRPIQKIVMEGAINRLRPVLLTATAAAFGFLPMAVSTSAGAEVQRPLATVVIGGLISATILTLFILPILYCIFGRNSISKYQPGKLVGIVIILLLPFVHKAQNPVSLNDAKNLLRQNNIEVLSQQKILESERELINGIKEIPKTNIFYGYDANNIAENNFPLHVLGIGQVLNHPLRNKRLVELQKSQSNVTEQQLNLSIFDLEYQLEFLFNEASYYNSLLQEYEYLDSIYREFSVRIERKFELGASNRMEYLLNRQKMEELEVKKQQFESRLATLNSQLNQILFSTEVVQFEFASFLKKAIPLEQTQTHPILVVEKSKLERSNAQLAVTKTQKLPEFEIAVFGGINTAEEARLYPGVELGIHIPISSKIYKAREQANILISDAQQISIDGIEHFINAKVEELTRQIELQNNIVQSYEDQLIPNVRELLATTERAFSEGQIEHMEFFINREHATNVQLEYLEKLYQYNQIIIELEYYLNQ